MLRIIAATEEHVNQLEGNLREADQLELDLCELTLMDNFEFSDFNYAVILAGKPIALMGYVEEEASDMAIPWFLGTDKCFEHTSELIPLAQFMCEFLLDRYGHIRNAVHEDNDKHIRWLSFMGFTFIEAEKTGGFIPFYKSRE